MFLTLFLVPLCVSLSHSAVTNQQMGIPSYFWPEIKNYWSLIEHGKGVGMAVINPNSGPGDERIQRFADVVKANVNAGHVILCYIDTGYFGLRGGRKTKNGESSSSAWMTQIKQEVDKAYQFYGDSGLSGILFDDALNTCGDNNNLVNLYKEIHDYVKSKHPGAKVGINPGTGVEECYTSVADIMQVFEHDYDTYLNYQQPAWQNNQGNGKIFWHTIYKAKDQGQMENAIKLSKQRNARYVFVTDNDLPEPGPWNTLPPYFEQELNVIQQN